jgi:hypothetical protein
LICVLNVMNCFSISIICCAPLIKEKTVSIDHSKILERG